jgi:hypothetical protein
MSYRVDVVDMPAPLSYEEALGLRDELAREQDERAAASGQRFEPPAERMATLHRTLTGRFPCICDDDAGPWSDGPLINNFGREVATLGISFSRVEEVLPFLIASANAQGMWVLDAQDEKLHLPDGTVRSAGESGPRGTWRRLGPAESAKADDDDRRRRTNPARAFLSAGVIVGLAAAAWSLGYRGGSRTGGVVFLAPGGRVPTLASAI